MVLPQKRILKSHYSPSPTPQTIFRGSNSHSQDSWCGNGSVKPQISLFNDSLPVSAAHYCHHFRASARGITNPNRLREEEWQSSYLPCTLACNVSFPLSSLSAFIICSQIHYCASVSENMTGNIVLPNPGELKEHRGSHSAVFDISHPMKSMLELSNSKKEEEKPRHSWKCGLKNHKQY